MKTIILILLPFIILLGNPFLNFNKPTEVYLQSLRAKYQSTLLKKGVDFQPIQIKDSTYILNANFLSDTSFTMVANDINASTYKDSLVQKTIEDTMFINTSF